MIYPDLGPIDWAILVGGDADATAAVAARDWKLAAAAKLAETTIPLARRLEVAGSLFSCSAETLKQEPLAARWYLDLAGLTGKLIAKLKASYSAAGLEVSPESIASGREKGRPILDDRLINFSVWINDILLELYPTSARTFDSAIASVLSIMGARINAQVQNRIGDAAVLVVKQLLVGAFSTRHHGVEIETAPNVWAPYGQASNLAEGRNLRFGKRLVAEFIPGGNRPDIKFILNGIPVAQGEIKGRTDLSNIWESWVPQIQGHLQTWAHENPLAPRLFFGTIVTPTMISGKTVGGTQHVGLQTLAKGGLLQGAYNLANIVEGHPSASASFDRLVDELCRNLP